MKTKVIIVKTQCIIGDPYRVKTIHGASEVSYVTKSGEVRKEVGDYLSKEELDILVTVKRYDTTVTLSKE